MAGKPAISRNSDTQPSHQERINLEMFRAIEMLGRKLERAEGERERFGRRLIQIESSATVDEKTGRLYLPVVASGAQLPQAAGRAPKWQGVATLMSSALALLAIGIVLFREPVISHQLTAQQLAALDALSHSRFARLDTARWQPLDAETARDTAVNDIDIRRFTATEDPAAAPYEPARAHPSAYTGEETTLAAAEHIPTAEELAAIEPAAGEAAVEAAPVPAAVVETPAPKPALVKAAKPAEEKPAAKKAPEVAALNEKPLQRPANDYAPIPLMQQQSTPAEAVIAEKPAARPSVKAAEKAAPVPVAASQSAVQGVQQDAALPAKLAVLEKRAFEGAPEAQHDLATIYAAGKLIAQDYKRAVFWFSQAADRGVANAHYNLGVMFQQGLGVRQDVNKSLGWYEKAAELGHPEAMYNLGIAYIEGIGTKRNISRGVTFFKQAANAGVAQAAYNLGVLYESNFIGPIDLAKASEWYQVAAGEGHVEAKQAIARIKTGFADSFDGETTADTGAATANDSGLKMAREAEPAAGGDEGYGEGDQSPLDEQGRANPPGFSDSLVRKIQEALITRGELPPSTTTGYMTQQTEDALRAWQKSLGWEVDGKPSRELLEKISKK